MARKLLHYHCDGICEDCEKGKWYERGQYYSCDPEKTKSVIVICPTPTMMRTKNEIGGCSEQQ